MHLEERHCFLRSQGKILWRKHCLQMIKMHAHTCAGKREQIQFCGHGAMSMIRELKAGKVNSPLELIRTIVLFSFILCFDLRLPLLSLSPLTQYHIVSTETEENCSFHVRAMHCPPFVFFRKCVPHGPLTGVFLPYLGPISKVEISRP